MVARIPGLIYDNAVGESIAASGTYKTAILDISEQDDIKIFAEFTYHASATKGGRVDIIPVQPDGSTEMSDAYCTAVTPSFATGSTKSKLGNPVNIYAVNKIKLAVVNEDTVRAMTLKKLYIY